MNAIYKFVMAFLAKKSGKAGITTIPKASGFNVESSVKQIEQTLKNMGVDISKIKDAKEVQKYLNIHESWMKQKVKKPPEKVFDLTGKKIDTSKPIIGGKNVELTHEEKIDWLVKNVSPTAEQTIPPKATLEAMLKDGRGDLIDHFFKMHTKKLSGKPQINIDTSDLKHPELVKKMMMDEKSKLKVIQGSKGILNKIEGRMDKIKGMSDELAKMGKERSGIFKGINYELMEEKLGIKLLRNENLDELIEIEKRIKEGIFPRHQRRYDEAMKAEELKMAKDEYHIPDIIDPEDFAYGGRASSGLNYLLGEDDQNVRMPVNQGGRIGLKKGHSPGRRKFLQGLATLATIPFIGKYFKWAKPLAKSSKVLTSVPIKAGVDGMPAWFKPLVNKVIKEGEDVTKKFSTMDREIVHAAELPGSKTKVLVSQDITTGNVSVDIGYGKHGFADGHLGQPVRLEYKASEWIETASKKGDVKPEGYHQKTEPEFWVEEAEFTGGHPENVKFEESTFEKFGEHGSDFSEVEKFATGKVKKAKPLKKREITEYEGEKAQADAERYWEEHGDYASGGRVPYFAGDIVDPEGYNISRREMGILANADPSQREMIREFLSSRRKHKPIHLDRILDINRGRRTGEASGGRVPLAGGLIVKGGNWLIKSLLDTRQQLKTMNLSPGQLKQYLNQIDDQIRRIKAGGPIPDEVIQTIRKDPKFKSVWQNQKSADPELREMEEVLLEYGQKHASGGLAGMLGE